jgi:glutamate synthase (NADPH/NADH) large chain
VQQGDYAEYKEYAALVNQRPPSMIRDLFKLKTDTQALPLSEVEPLESEPQALRLGRHVAGRAVA